MSFFEYRACMAGSDKQMANFQALGAWGCANLMNCWVEDTITPARLLGKEAPTRETTDPEEFRARMRARQARARMEDV